MSNKKMLYSKIGFLLRFETGVESFENIFVEI